MLHVQHMHALAQHLNSRLCCEWLEGRSDVQARICSACTLYTGHWAVCLACVCLHIVLLVHACCYPLHKCRAPSGTCELQLCVSCCYVSNGTQGMTSRCCMYLHVMVHG